MTIATDDAFIPSTGTDPGAQINPNGQIRSGFDSSTETSTNFIINRINSDSGRLIQFHREGAQVANIRLNGETPADGVIFDAGGTATVTGAFIISSDRRLRTNIVDAPSAAGLVKALKPRQYDLAISKNVRGFIADELQQVVPEAVVGTKDAEEAIGTLRDALGNILENNVAEPSASEMIYGAG